MKIFQHIFVKPEKKSAEMGMWNRFALLLLFQVDVYFYIMLLCCR